MDWDTAYDLFLLELEAQGRSELTLDHHNRSRKQFMAWVRDQPGLDGPGDLKRADLLRFVSWLRTRPLTLGGNHPYPAPPGRTLKQGAVWSYFTDVRTFLAWCVDQEILAKNPAAKLVIRQADELPKPFTNQELAAMWQVALAVPRLRGIRVRAVLSFLMDTGCRVSEVVGIRPEDFVWDQKLALVTGKGGKQRMVAFSAQTAVFLKRWAAVRFKDRDRFFLNDRMDPWTRNSLEHLVTRIGQKAGVRKAHPHRFRASYATRAAATGNLFAVQAQLGHSTLEMTRRYAEVGAKDIRDNHDATSIMRNLLGPGKGKK